MVVGTIIGVISNCVFGGTDDAFEGGEDTVYVVHPNYILIIIDLSPLPHILSIGCIARLRDHTG